MLFDRIRRNWKILHSWHFDSKLFIQAMDILPFTVQKKYFKGGKKKSTITLEFKDLTI